VFQAQAKIVSFVSGAGGGASGVPSAPVSPMMGASSNRRGASAEAISEAPMSKKYQLVSSVT